MAAFIIRRATIEDSDRIAFVRITGWKQSYAGLMPDALLSRLDMKADAERVRAVMADNSNRSLRFVAEQDGVVVGMGACGPARGDEGAKGRGEVYAIYLLDEVKRQGMGLAFMREMARAMSAQGLTSLQICVLENNEPARKFYEKLGGKLQKSGIFTYEGFQLPDVTYFWDDLKALCP